MSGNKEPEVDLRPLRGRKALGQHFLRDRRILSRIVRAIAPTPTDAIVEVGAGHGVLTRPLAQRSGRVIALEVDETLCGRLAATSRQYANVTVVRADVLSLPVEELLKCSGVQGPYSVVGNLPYYIAAAVVRHFLEAPRPPERLVVTVQKEVAENMAAPPGRMNLLGASVQFYAETRILFLIPPAAFSPPPKVWSALVRLDVRPQPAVAVDDRDEFFRLLRAGFRAPRKQLHNALALGLGLDAAICDRLLASSGIDGRRRAQTLTLAEWGDLYRTWRDLPAPPGHLVRQNRTPLRGERSERSDSPVDSSSASGGLRMTGCYEARC